MPNHSPSLCVHLKGLHYFRLSKHQQHSPVLGKCLKCSARPFWSVFAPIPNPSNHWSAFCVYKFAFYRYFIKMEPYSM